MKKATHSKEQGRQHKANYSTGSVTPTANKSLAAHTAFGYSIGLAANSVSGFSRPTVSRRTAPRKRFFCAHSMVGCAWEAFAPAGFLDAGRLTHAQFATHCLVAVLADSNLSRSSTMKTLTLPLAARIKRDRIAAHKAMAYAALHADSSLNVRMARYNNHMNQARAIADGALAQLNTSTTNSADGV